MSQQAGIQDLTFVASVNLVSSQYKVVKMSGSTTPLGVELPTAVTDGAVQTDVQIGVLQNEPLQSGAAVVRVAGTTKVIAGTPIAIGAYVCSGSPAGYIQTAAVDKSFVIGIAMETAAASGDIIEILLTHFKASI
ncbi:MAG: hypothetical protein NTV30_08930 [Chloroflexi bacterium]|nr:hypothetical protein [Chloroflexota bacterium]